MERMIVTYEKWIVLHHKNVQQSTAGQYPHVMIDICLQEIQRRVTGDRSTYLTVFPKCNGK